MARNEKTQYEIDILTSLPMPCVVKKYTWMNCLAHLHVNVQSLQLWTALLTDNCLSPSRFFNQKKTSTLLKLWDDNLLCSLYTPHKRWDWWHLHLAVISRSVWIFCLLKLIICTTRSEIEILFSMKTFCRLPLKFLFQVTVWISIQYYSSMIEKTRAWTIPWVMILFTDLLKASVSFSALKSRENALPKTGIVVKRGPGGMSLNW